MKIKCLLVDDESLALALLAKFIGDTPDLEVSGQCKNSIQAIEILQNEPIQLLFLDIQMPVLSGINLLRTVSHRPVTIFTTAYPQYAAEAYELDAVDYLLKPYSANRFAQAVEKARAVLRLRNAALPKLEGYLTVKADRQWVKIAFQDIYYVEGWKEYVKIFTDTGKVVTLESLNNLEKLLPTANFLRVHKSYIVAQTHVQRMDGHELILTNNMRIPVARARKQIVIALLFGSV